MREKTGVQNRTVTEPGLAGPLLRVVDLKLYFRTTQGIVQAVDNISFALGRTQALAILGESGCGKTSLAKAILRLLPRNVHTYSGRVELDGVDVMPWSEERFRKEVRWTKISMVAQAAMNSLNPVLKVGEQIAEPLIIHKGMDKKGAWARAREAVQLVGVPADFLQRYPFELSGGMRQRVVIAMALVTNPDLIILDEPTSALDVLTQANIMNVLKNIKREFQKSFVLITHDIATSSELADSVAIMYAGQLVEWGTAEQFYPKPLHPYSQKLMASVPRLREDRPLEFIAGRPPSLINPPKGCRFAARCPAKFSQCEQEPPMIEVQGGRLVKCWLYR
ncbi:Oligopeptide transport ATP-binding protein OppD [bacterium HR07]|uniref:Peptide/nickel transport system ATP-binding protein n=1 Tax=Acetithermum autotrophicum TaxID=1446466 RepID=H5SQE4_ACEAU|nr:peptide/nickel transport system ATP-binding protein [Candidatus Acetothermum autotrophicum]GBC75903.1 Oligopeptide transport ATP-binding protein OppD [bacterium HR07]